MKKKKNMVIAAVTAVVFCVLAVSIFIATTGRPEGKLAEQLELGQKYLEELDYENAIVAYQAAIEIDPRQEEAYLGLAQAYEAMGDYQAAVDILQQGIAAAEPESLEGELARLRRRLAAGITRQLEDGSYQIAEYDDNGKIVRRTEYYADGRINRIWEYDENGKRIRNTAYYYHADGTLDFYFITEYDENENDVRGTGYNYLADGTLERYFTVEYDEAGNAVRHAFYYPDGTLDQYYISEYDENGYVVRENYYGADGTLNSYNIMEYDENGNRVGSTLHSADGTPLE